jgi:hypothetical protein
MKSLSSNLRVIFAVLLMIVGVSSLSAAQTSGAAFVWTQAHGMVSIGTLPGGEGAAGWSINGSGEVVGTSSSATASTAMRWTKNGGMQVLIWTRDKQQQCLWREL